MGHHYGNGEYRIDWELSNIDTFSISGETYYLTSYVKSEIEKVLREELPKQDYFNDFFGNISITKIFAFDISRFGEDIGIKNATISFNLELEYCCYCSDYGSSGVNQNIDIDVTF